MMASAMHTRFTAAILGVIAACGSPESTVAQERPLRAAPTSATVRAADALLTGHTGLAGYSFAGGGSTLFVATEQYHGGPTRLTSYWVDLRSATSRPVRIHEGDDGPYLGPQGASDDGRFVLETHDDGLHIVSRDGASDHLVPESARYWFSPAISADGSAVAFVRDDELRIFTSGSARLERVRLPSGSSAMPLLFVDPRTVLLGGTTDGRRWVRRIAVGARSEDVCTDCSSQHVGREGRLAEAPDGALSLVTAGGSRPIGRGAAVALSPSGRVWARIEFVEARPYEYERHLYVEGLPARVDAVLAESLAQFGDVRVGEDGTTVAEAAVRRWDDGRQAWDTQSCVVVLHPYVRVVACEPCDSTSEHCR